MRAHEFLSGRADRGGCAFRYFRRSISGESLPVRRGGVFARASLRRCQRVSRPCGTCMRSHGSCRVERAAGNVSVRCFVRIDVDVDVNIDVL